MYRQMRPADASLATAGMIENLRRLAGALPPRQQPGLRRALESAAQMLEIELAFPAASGLVN